MNVVLRHATLCVSGHRSESSIRSYASKTTDKLKFAMSTGLSSALCNETGLRSAVCDETGVLCVEPESSAVNQPLQTLLILTTKVLT